MRNTEVRQIHDNTDSLIVMIKALDDKFTLWMAEADKRTEQRFNAQQDALKTALISAEKAVAKAELASERRFESVNEFRKTLSDQTATFIPRIEYSTQHGALVEKVDSSLERLTQLESGHAGKAAGMGFVFSVILGCVAAAGAVAAVITAVLK